MWGRYVDDADIADILWQNHICFHTYLYCFMSTLTIIEYLPFVKSQNEGSLLGLTQMPKSKCQSWVLVTQWGNSAVRDEISGARKDTTLMPLHKWNLFLHPEASLLHRLNIKPHMTHTSHRISLLFFFFLLLFHKSCYQNEMLYHITLNYLFSSRICSRTGWYIGANFNLKVGETKEKNEPYY